MCRRRREHARPVVRHHLVEDLLLRPPLGDPPSDLGLHLLGNRGVRLVERLVAVRAHELGLEIRFTRPRRGDRRCGESQQRAACRRAPSRAERAVDAGGERGGRNRPEHVVDDPTATIDEERLRRARSDSPRIDGRARAGRTPSDTSRRSGVANARAGPFDNSSTSTPTTMTPRFDQVPAKRDSRRGISSLHGAQSDAQKLTTTALPCNDASDSFPPPVSRARWKFGAWTT